MNNPLIQVPSNAPTVVEPPFGCACSSPTLLGSIILGLSSRALTYVIVRAYARCRELAKPKQ